MEKLFVYGTLLGDDSGDHKYGTKGRIVSSRHATIKAQLFVFSIPYIVLGEEGTVHGKVFEVDDELVKGYDHVEGVKEGFYERTRTKARYDDGTAEEVWAYCFPKEKGGREQLNGQFEDWLDRGLYPIPKGMQR